MANILKTVDSKALLKITYAHRKEGARGYDVAEVSRALAALNTDFKQWIKKQRHNDKTDGVPHHSQLRLTITSIEKGSSCLGFESEVITAADIARIAAPIVTDTTIQMTRELVKGWGKDLVKVLRKMSRKDGLKGIDSKDIKKYKDLSGGQTTHMSGINISGNNNTFIYQQILNIHKNLEEASPSRKVRPIKKVLPMTKVAMTIVSVDRRPGKDSMALVEEISSEPKPISMPPGMRMRLLSGSSNPLTADLEVDLEVIMENDEIKRYKLVKIHGELQEPTHRRI